MIDFPSRLSLLHTALQEPLAQHFLGKITHADLLSWIDYELGSYRYLEGFYETTHQHSRAIPPQHLYHILSSNTPHAGFQSLLRGLIIGTPHHFIKLPHTGLAPLEDWLKKLPNTLYQTLHFSREHDWGFFKKASTVVAFGSDDTLNHIAKKIRFDQKLIAHPHKVSTGVLFDDWHQGVKLIAKDMLAFDQRGCLSLKSLYVYVKDREDLHTFLPLLAQSLTHYCAKHPPSSLDLGDAGQMTHLRETTRFLVANQPHWLLMEGEQLHWTIIAPPSPSIRPAPGRNLLFVYPFFSPQGKDIDFASDAPFLSTIGIYPFCSQRAQELALEHPASRFCPLGRMQHPPLFWHHDGFPSLSSLLHWQDIQTK